MMGRLDKCYLIENRNLLIMIFVTDDSMKFVTDEGHFKSTSKSEINFLIFPFLFF